MWILLVILVFFFVDGKTINEFLHAMTAAACQLYLVLLHLRHAAQHCAKAAWTILLRILADYILVRYGSKFERFRHALNCNRSGTVHFLEAVCLILESLAQFLTVVSTLCVAIRQVPQAALFLIASTVRWAAQQMLLPSNEDMDAWEKIQKQTREEIQKQTGQLGEYLNPDQFTGKKRR